MLLDKMVFGIRDNSVKEKLLTRGNLKLKEAIDVASCCRNNKKTNKTDEHRCRQRSQPDQ